MEQVLRELGLTSKEVRFYLHLLSEGSQSASQIAKATKESRTNTYMVLEQLIERKLVIADNSTPVKTFASVDPNQLKNSIADQQQVLRRNQIDLNGVLPQLVSMFNLSNHKPGVVYFQGIDGFKLLLEDMSKSKDDVNLIASDTGPATKETWDVLLKGLAKRKARKIKTRAIFHQNARDWPTISDIKSRGFEIGLWSKKPLEGEIVVYGSKIALTVYEPAIVVMVITNEILARTFTTIFEEMWSQASKV